MMHKFQDRASVGTVKRTSEGYVSAFAKSVKAGVQDYGAWENEQWLDMAKAVGKGITDTVRVYRPPESVFSKDSLASAVHIPVTLGHPPEMVDASNWSKYAIGETGSEIMRDGEMVAFSLMLKDNNGISAYDNGVVELSAGYTADLNIADAGSEYDYIMGPPKYNHLALVPKGRAKTARIGDSAANQWGAAPLTTSNEVPKVEMKAVAIGDKAINVAATDADALNTAITAKDKQIGELTAKLADAESKILTDEQIKERAQVIADAMARREKVAAALGDKTKDMTDAQIEGALAFMDAGVTVGTTHTRAFGDAMKSIAKEQDPLAAFYAKRDKEKAGK